MYLSKRTQIRLPTIKDGLRKGLNYDSISESCGVTSQTIDRDMKAWVQSGEFEVWLKTEFAELHGYAREANPMEAYKEIAKIVGRMVTRKVEKTLERTDNITISWEINDSSAKDKVSAAHRAEMLSREHGEV